MFDTFATLSLMKMSSQVCFFTILASSANKLTPLPASRTEKTTMSTPSFGLSLLPMTPTRAEFRAATSAHTQSRHQRTTSTSYMTRRCSLCGPIMSSSAEWWRRSARPIMRSTWHVKICRSTSPHSARDSQCSSSCPAVTVSKSPRSRSSLQTVTW